MEEKLNEIFNELQKEAYNVEYHTYDYKLTNQIIRKHFEKLVGQIEPLVTKSEHTEGSFASGAVVKGNVVERKSDKHRFVVYGHNIEEVNNDIENYNFICEKPHEDGRFDYLCNNIWCRCR